MGDDEVKKLVEAYQKCDAFFKEALDKAIQNQHVKISEEAASYLLWILLLGLKLDPHFNAETTIKRYINSFTGKGPESFRDIGDSSLIIAGVWPDSLIRRLVSIDYYIQIGKLAYKKEAETNLNLGELFEELSDNFLKSVNILMEATQFISKDEPAPGMILKIYEKWLQTHNEFHEKLLRKLGVDPVYLKPRKQ